MAFSDMATMSPFVRFARRTGFFPLPYTVCTCDHRVFYLLEGECRLTVAGETRLISADTLMVWPGGTPYRFETLGPARMIVINFDYTRADPVEKTFHPAPPDSFAGPREAVSGEAARIILLPGALYARQKLWELCGEFERGMPYSRECASSLLRCTLLETFRRLAGPPEYEWLEKLLSYISEHYAEPLDNGRLAAVAGYHPYHINRVMRARLGVTLHGYLLRQRLDAAQYLLENTSLSITQIAERCGFSSQAYFSDVYRRRMGQMPSSVRGGT